MFLFFANHYVVPYSNAKKLAFESTYFPGGYKSSDQNIHIRLSSNDFLFLENYNHRENEGYKLFTKYLYDQNSTIKYDSDIKDVIQVFANF